MGTFVEVRGGLGTPRVTGGNATPRKGFRGPLRCSRCWTLRRGWWVVLEPPVHKASASGGRRAGGRCVREAGMQ